jgi:hypothetical protein
MDELEIKEFKKKARFSLKLAQKVKKEAATEKDSLDILNHTVNLVFGPGYKIVKDKGDEAGKING